MWQKTLGNLLADEEKTCGYIKAVLFQDTVNSMNGPRNTTTEVLKKLATLRKLVLGIRKKLSESPLPHSEEKGLGKLNPLRTYRYQENRKRQRDGMVCEKNGKEPQAIGRF